MQRRSFLHAAAGAALGTLALGGLSACGFKLRGQASIPFHSVYFQAAEDSPLARQLQRALQDSGVTVLRPPATPDQAERIFELLGEQHERSILSQSATGSVRELQLRLRVRYRLRDGRSAGLASDASVVELLQSRDLSYDESLALAKEAEEDMLLRDMQNDLVAQILRRLAAS
ncbi:hypothetical protein D8I35_14400 [Corticibacter populi]|uniref:LPS-assembly lipoprotein LptE n=1 Tax=Corticibacter populi TaxID=1550736 RepID=A0A3M6QPW1_9BURK|nr:LPS assembly lipoprotein LptE [Corticibacter populi]RMX05033.1 hypothetical protein D8I35_14400 [Corticibacter populi]RZS33531.1 LPS-assembly lipoprotein [Corticibacter populi]